MFKTGICSTLLTLGQWRHSMLNKFGKTASDCPAFHRLISNLTTRAGLSSIKSLMESNIPIHGKSAQVVGTPDTYTINILCQCL